MTYPQISFVESPSEDAAVRLDLNSEGGGATCRVEHDSFSLGAPPLLGDPDVLSAALGLRAASWVLQIKGPKGAAYDVRTAVSRELLRPTNWVRIRLAPTAPVHYMKSYRSDLSPLDLTFVKNASGSDVWRLPVALAGEPLLLGEKITLGPYTVTQDATGTNPMRVALPAIEGDAPAPLTVSIAPANGYTAYNGSEWLIASASGATEMIDPVVNIGSGDGGSEGVDGAAVTTGATGFFSSDYRTVSLPGTDPNKLAWSSFPLTVRGRYKILQRIEATGSATYLFALSQGGIGTPAYTPLAVASNPFEGWVDIGNYTFPAVALPDESQLAINLADAGLLADTAGTDTGTVKLDALKLIPLDGPTVSNATALRAKFSTTGTIFQDPTVAYLDGDSQSAWLEVNTSGTYGKGPVTLSGAFPVADPAAEQNLLVVMALTAGDGPAGTRVTDPGAPATVTISYYPRKLHI